MAPLFGTMKCALFLILVVSMVNVQARKKKPKLHPVTQNKIFPGFRYPFFAIRFPLIGNEEEDTPMKPSSLVFDDGKKGKLKTRTKTSNSTNGPFKTFTVTSVTTSGNKSNPQMFEKVIQSVTTLNKNDTDKNSTQPAFRETKFIFRPFGFFNRLNDQFNDESLKPCSPKKPCASGDQFCDKFFGVCKKRVGEGEDCSQKDQCTSKSGNLQCTWGKCKENSEVGGLGTFCDAQKDCHASSNGEELGCFLQPDISRFSKICIAKLQEGDTCGRRRLFDMFEDEVDEDSQLCKKNLVCRAVGFLGRKICQKAEDSTDVKVQKVEKKSKKHRRHKH